MVRDRPPTTLTPQTSLESVHSNDAGNDETVKSNWSRLRQRLHEAATAGRYVNRRNKFGSLLKLAGEERRITHYSRKCSSQVQLSSTEDGVTALWRDIHMLEERVEVLENTLEASRERITRTEEKYDNLQKLVEKLLNKQLAQPPLDADKSADGDAFKEKLRLCFEQIRNRQYRLNPVWNKMHDESGNRMSESETQEEVQAAGCGKSTF